MEESEKKAGFTYLYSNTLKQDVAINDRTGVLYCRDGVTYTPFELNKLNVIGVEIPLSVHIVKRCFGGILEDIR